MRKVLDASMASILGMFTKEFLGLVLLAFTLAAPVAYFVMDLWHEDFAYRISIGPMLFIIAIAVTTTVAALTIGYRALKSAIANPVETLRNE